MDFPAAPIDGQSFIDFNGNEWVYRSVRNRWEFQIPADTTFSLPLQLDTVGNNVELTMADLHDAIQTATAGELATVDAATPIVIEIGGEVKNMPAGSGMTDALVDHFTTDAADRAAMQTALQIVPDTDTRIVLSLADTNADGTDDALRAEVFAVDTTTGNVTGAALSTVDLDMQAFVEALLVNTTAPISGSGTPVDPVTLTMADLATAMPLVASATAHANLPSQQPRFVINRSGETVQTTGGGAVELLNDRWINNLTLRNDTRAALAIQEYDTRVEITRIDDDGDGNDDALQIDVRTVDETGATFGPVVSTTVLDLLPVLTNVPTPANPTTQLPITGNGTAGDPITLTMGNLANATLNATVGQIAAVTAATPVEMEIGGQVVSVPGGEGVTNALVDHYTADAAERARMRTALDIQEYDTRVVVTRIDDDGDGNDDALQIQVFNVNDVGTTIGAAISTTVLDLLPILDNVPTPANPNTQLPISGDGTAGDPITLTMPDLATAIPAATAAQIAALTGNEPIVLEVGGSLVSTSLTDLINLRLVTIAENGTTDALGNTLHRRDTVLELSGSQYLVNSRRFIQQDATPNAARFPVGAKWFQNSTNILSTVIQDANGVHRWVQIPLRS